MRHKPAELRWEVEGELNILSRGGIEAMDLRSHLVQPIQCLFLGRPQRTLAECASGLVDAAHFHKDLLRDRAGEQRHAAHANIDPQQPSHHQCLAGGIGLGGIGDIERRIVEDAI